ncbi:MAG: hypothetical protein JXR49_09130 [Acidobacteria bacterium]|nr:hypothetical protein [Acidobacteriota bacterium]
MKRLFKFYIFATMASALILFPAMGSYLIGAPLFQDEAEGNSVEYETEEEYDAAQKEYDTYNAAVNEPDLLKRGEMLFEFIKTYPKSDYIELYVNPTYLQLLTECNDNQNFEALEELSEKWLELHPDDTRAIAYAYRAAVKLNHDEKSIKYALKIYEIQPTVGLALSVAQTYDRLGNFEKYVEWCETVFTYPEYSVDYTLRFEILRKYADEGNIAKAAQYADQILKVLESTEKPDAAGRENLATIQRICHHIIGIHYFDTEKFQEAIKYFDAALKNEGYQEGFYYIARCHWALSEGLTESEGRTEVAELAADYFAAAEIFGGEYTQRAKEYKEQLYKPLHNNSLFAIEKVDKRGQAIIDKYSGQKKTELTEVR